MHVTISQLACIALGAVAHWLWTVVRRPPCPPVIAPARALPPGTRRAIDDAARANRYRLPPPRWVSPECADFDHEETR